MNHLIVIGAGITGLTTRCIRRYLIRQGLDVLVDKSVLEASALSSFNSTYTPDICISPNKQRMIMTGGNSNSTANQMFITIPDVTDLTTSYVPPSTFAAIVQSVACSDTYYAVAGSNPFLYVWDWATNSLQSIETTGLGNVSCIRFSPDQTKLLVSHSTTPYLRVYNVADWSYTNAVTAPGANRYTCGWTADGSSAVACGAASPFFCSYTPDLATRNVALTTATYTMDGYGFVMPHWSKPKAVIVGHGINLNTTYDHLYEYDFATSTKTAIIPAATSAYCTSAAYDPTNNTLYAIGGTTGVYFSLFDGTTYAAKSADKELAYLHWSGLSRIAILARDQAQITGSVRDISNNPVAREVDIYERSSGILVARTMSDAVTGNYTAKLPYDGTFDAQFKIAPGELLNDLFFARATPALV